MVGKAKHNKGGSETGKYPPCQEEWQHLSTSLMQNAPTHWKRDPHHLWRGAFIPSIRNDEDEIMKKPEMTARAWGHDPQETGGVAWTP